MGSVRSARAMRRSRRVRPRAGYTHGVPREPHTHRQPVSWRLQATAATRRKTLKLGVRKDAKGFCRDIVSDVENSSRATGRQLRVSRAGKVLVWSGGPAGRADRGSRRVRDPARRRPTPRPGGAAPCGCARGRRRARDRRGRAARAAGPLSSQRCGWTRVTRARLRARCGSLLSMHHPCGPVPQRTTTIELSPRAPLHTLTPMPLQTHRGTPVLIPTHNSCG